MRFLISYYDANGLSHSFKSTALGGIFLALSGLLFDFNIGRLLTGLLIASRGAISEISRKNLMQRTFSEKTAALPGMFIAALMNWPAFLNSQTYEEAIAFGLASLVLTMKFIQYFPEGISEFSQRLAFENNILEKILSNVEKINITFLNNINKYAGFSIIFSAYFFMVDVISRNDILGIIACFFLVYGGLVLAIKTKIELSLLVKEII